ncbi:hypothetical protein ANTRET_LOCUS1780 [Anthophora retusa]
MYGLIRSEEDSAVPKVGSALVRRGPRKKSKRKSNEAVKTRGQDVTGNARLELRLSRNEGWWTGNEDRNGPTTPRGTRGTGRGCQKTTVHR